MLQEENLSLRQQLLLGRSARGGALGDVALLQSKLKQAARLISSLSQDKRQLIEMGNRLRAQLIEAGIEVPRDPKIIIKPSNVPEQSLVGKDPCQSEHGLRSKSRLSTLEQLQYQLTTQELQYAQRDQNKRKPIVVHPRFSDSESSEKHRSINPWDPPARSKFVGSKENTSPQPNHSDHVLLSSVGTDESLQEVWKMLDRGLSSSLFSPSESEDKGNVAADKRAQDSAREQPTPLVSVEGTKASLQEKKQSRTFVHEQKTRPVGNLGRIRNYNIKD
ncbi:putative coiled-coil domain-containing protein 57 [Triplophysa rosa]|uniref:Coiled-coil domain-containing protein 57 n=2 Tax=Triplophysa rosa TaxID=992332 RepID=A0A9W7TE87_TRIRA|nr:putative coiled-coil domain-containing protein 57 [Triplophysa rosa]